MGWTILWVNQRKQIKAWCFTQTLEAGWKKPELCRSLRRHQIALTLAGIQTKSEFCPEPTQACVHYRPLGDPTFLTCSTASHEVSRACPCSSMPEQAYSSQSRPLRKPCNSWWRGRGAALCSVCVQSESCCFPMSAWYLEVALRERWDGDKVNDAVYEQRQVGFMGGRCTNLPYKVSQGPCDSNLLRSAGYMFVSIHSKPAQWAELWWHNSALPECPWHDDTEQGKINKRNFPVHWLSASCHLPAPSLPEEWCQSS